MSVKDFIKFIGIPSPYHWTFITPMSLLMRHHLINKKREINPGCSYGTFYVVCKKPIDGVGGYMNFVVLEHEENKLSKLPIRIVRTKSRYPNCTEYKEYDYRGYFRNRNHIMGKSFHDMIKRVVKENKYARTQGRLTEEKAIEIHTKYTKAVQRAFKSGTPENEFMKNSGRKMWCVPYYCLRLYSEYEFTQARKCRARIFYKKKEGLLAPSLFTV